MYVPIENGEVPMSSHINLQVFMCLKDMFQGYVGGFSSEIKIQVWPIQNWFLGMQSVLGPGPRHMILFLRWGYGLVTSFGYVFNHWCIFFGILIYEFLLEMQKFKVILSSKKFSAKKWSNPRKFPPKIATFSSFKHPPGLRVDDPMRGA